MNKGVPAEPYGAPPSYERTMGHEQMMPPAGGMGPGIPMQHTQQFAAVHTTSAAVIVTGGVPMGPNPSSMRCPNCNMDIVTTVEYENRPSAHIACILMFLLGCCLCSCIPYCMDSFKSANHSCPNCKTFLGQYKS